MWRHIVDGEDLSKPKQIFGEKVVMLDRMHVVHRVIRCRTLEEGGGYNLQIDTCIKRTDSMNS